jgi:protein phosphatase
MPTNSEQAAEPDAAAADTAEFSTAARFADYFFASETPALRVTSGGATHTGRVRENNEDHFAVIRRTRTREVLITNLPADSMLPSLDEAYMLLVADGIGGTAFGELASRLAIQTAWELAGNATSWVMKVTDLDAQQLRERIGAYVDRIEQRFREYGRSNPELVNMGTTLTCAYVMDRDVVITHLGDSRAYLCRDGNCTQITRDHTMGEILKSAGMDPAHVERLRHVLVNCLAVNHKTKAFPELQHVEVQDGDRLLLCTDGLSDMVTDADIGRVVAEHADPQSACQELVRLALKQGGKDNVTVVLAAFSATIVGNGDSPESQEPTRVEPF